MGGAGAGAGGRQHTGAGQPATCFRESLAVLSSLVAATNLLSLFPKPIYNLRATPLTCWAVRLPRARRVPAPPVPPAASDGFVVRPDGGEGRAYPLCVHRHWQSFSCHRWQSDSAAVLLWKLSCTVTSARSGLQIVLTHLGSLDRGRAATPCYPLQRYRSFVRKNDRRVLTPVLRRCWEARPARAPASSRLSGDHSAPALHPLTSWQSCSDTPALCSAAL